MSLGSDLSQVEIGLAVAAGTAVGSGVWHGAKALGAAAMEHWRFRSLDRKTRRLVKGKPGSVFISIHDKEHLP